MEEAYYERERRGGGGEGSINVVHTVVINAMRARYSNFQARFPTGNNWDCATRLLASCIDEGHLIKEVNRGSWRVTSRVAIIIRVCFSPQRAVFYEAIKEKRKRRRRRKRKRRDTHEIIHLAWINSKEDTFSVHVYARRRGGAGG